MGKNEPPKNLQGCLDLTENALSVVHIGDLTRGPR